MQTCLKARLMLSEVSSTGRTTSPSYTNCESLSQGLHSGSQARGNIGKGERVPE